MCDKATKSRGYVQISTAVNRDISMSVSSDAGKIKVSEVVTPERVSPVRKHSQQFYKHSGLWSVVDTGNAIIDNRMLGVAL
jgi:hypothetical protein